MRHALAAMIGELGDIPLVQARNVAEDAGRLEQTEQEYRRESIAELLIANLRRAQQSMRVLEESLKGISRPLALRAEALRYELYQLESAAASSDEGRRGLGHAHLCALLDGRDDLDQFTSLATELVEAEIDLIQLRDKSLSDRELLARSAILRRLTEGRATRWIVNDRADLAALAGADGVHLGQDDISVAQARRIVGPRRWIGVSTHSLEQAEQAVFDGANYLGVGPTFASQTKHFEQLCGLDCVAEIVSQIAIPCFAIGGITLHNVDQLTASCVRRVAVGNAIVGASSPGQTVRQFLAKLRGGAEAHGGSCRLR
jgi:thiamine-phosphate pyrophosphorylase